MDKFHVSQVDNDGNPRNGGIVKTIWDLVLIGALFILATLALSTRQQTSPNNSSQNSLNTVKVVSQPSEFLGKTVTIETNNIQSVGRSAFTVNEERNFRRKSLLVINASGELVEFPNDSDTKIQVVGQVRKLSVAGIEREFNLELPDNDYRRFENQPVLIAQRIELTSKPTPTNSNLSTTTRVIRDRDRLN